MTRIVAASSACLLLVFTLPARGQQSARLSERNALAWVAARLARAGQVEQAGAALHKMLDAERAIFGPENEDVAGALEYAAGIQDRLADFGAARTSLTEALALRTKLAGKEHFRTVDARYALERIERLVPLDAEKRRGYREALQLETKARALNYNQQRERSKLARQAAEKLKEVLGPGHPEFAAMLHQIAELEGGGNAARAQEVGVAELYRQALTIRKEALGDRHPDYASSLERVAVVGRGTDVALLREAAEIRKQAQGEWHPAYARTLESLGYELLNRQRRPDEAVPLLKQALAIRQKAFGADDPGCVNLLNYLASHYRQKRQFREAEPYLRQGLATARKRLETEVEIYEGRWTYTLGVAPEMADRPIVGYTAAIKRQSYAFALHNLAALYWDMEDPEQAARLLGEAQDYQAESHHLMAAARSEAEVQMLAAGWIHGLDDFLSASVDPRAKVSPEESYRHVLAWKGAGFMRQREVRSWRDRAELLPLFSELRDISEKLAAALRARPADDDHAAWDRIAQLHGRKQEVDALLGKRLREVQGGSKRPVPTAKQLQALLPADVALVDFVRFFPWFGDARANNYHLLAFVVRSQGPVVRLDLGPVWPVEQGLDAWQLKARAYQDAQEELKTLHRLLWQPQAAHLQDIKTVLISPDGVLSRLPWAALPGKERDAVLADDYALAIVPVPQLLLATGRGRPRGTDCLLVGEVDFGAGPAAPRPQPSGGTPPPGATMPKFSPLPGTSFEVDAVAKLYKAAQPEAPLRVLRGGEASKPAVRAAAGRCRYLHLATHGYFRPQAAPADARLPPEGQHLIALQPGLLAGIALAGANQTPPSGGDTGVLTAEEAQQLDLEGTDLVVLSACETALGAPLKGEGMMGLQRAFQVAGASALVSSLWQVDDAATSVLMEEFYANLWQRKLPKLEALRQAQRAVRREPERVLRRGRQMREMLLQRGWSEDVLASRGLGKKAAKVGDEDQPARRSPAAWWAGFVLSGDWR